MTDNFTDIFDLIDQMSEQQQRLFACDCAEHVLHWFAEVQPHDPRLHMALETARRFAIGEATQKELIDAAREAEAAAWEVSTIESIHVGAAATAAACVVTAVWQGLNHTGSEAENARETALTVVKTAIETVETAVAGASMASDSESSLDSETIEGLQRERHNETVWQRMQAFSYLSEGYQ